MLLIQSEEKKDNALKIPEWVKTNAQWWSANQISDSDFAKGLEHLIKIGVISTPHNTNPVQAESETQIPEWLRILAGGLKVCCLVGNLHKVCNI